MAVFIGNKGFQAALQGKKADHDILQIITRTLILRAIITCTVAKKKNLSSAFTKDKSSPVTWKDSARLRKQLVFVVEPSFWLPGGFFFFLHGFNTARPDYLQGTRRNKKNTPPLFHCAFGHQIALWNDLYLFWLLNFSTKTANTTLDWGHLCQLRGPGGPQHSFRLFFNATSFFG